MKKIFTSYETVRNNALKLALKIYEDGFIPDVIYVFLRGGAYMGNVISEFFKAVCRQDHQRRPVFYAAVVARSYTGFQQETRIMVDGWTYSPQHLRIGDRVLFVDDIFDSGKTIRHLVGVVLDRGISPDDIRIAVHDFKDFPEDPERSKVRPDYCCRHHIIKNESEDFWVHYLAHELDGLTEQEIEENYLTKPDKELRRVFTLLQKENLLSSSKKN